MKGTYIYGITEWPIAVPKDIPGIGGHGPVGAVAHEELCCLTSDWAGPEFSALPREQLVRCLLAHQQAVERFMQDYTVLPVKFGTVVGTEEDPRYLLRQGYTQFANALSSARGKVELELAATWDVDRVLREVSSEDDIAKARATIAADGLPVLERKMRLGQAVKACLDRRRESCRDQVVDALKPLSMDMVFNALLSDSMVLNVAFLAHREVQGEFERRIQKLDALFQGSLSFRLIGPMPLYSFSTVVVKRLTPGEVDSAKRALQLGDKTSAVDVRTAYRRLAAAEIREVAAGNKTASPRMMALKQAADLLLGYCRTSETAQDTCTFSIDVRSAAGEEVESARFGAGAGAGAYQG